MIISHRYKFIFIKTMKTAGSSIELNFGRHHMGAMDVLTVQDEDRSIHQNNTGWFNPLPELLDRSYRPYRTLQQFYHRHKFGPHQSARVVQHRIPQRVWKSYFKFCVERNPYDKMVSMFYMNWGKSGTSRPGKSFDDWVRRGKNLPVNYPLYTWQGDVIVDRVVQYEHLSQELADVYWELGVPFKGLTERAKGGFRRGADYRKLHTDFTREFTERHFGIEIDLFDYDF